MSSLQDRSAIINLLIKYGAIVLFLSALANIYLVLKYRELHTKAGEAELIAQRHILQQRAVESVLREFSLRASNDPAILQILRRAQEASNAARQNATQPGAPTTLPSQ